MKDDGIITVDIGATWTRIALVRRDGVIHCYRKTPTPKLEFQPLIDQSLEAVKNADCYVPAIVFGVPGPVAYSQHKVVKLPNLWRWDVEALSLTIRELTGPLGLLANDTDLAVLGEYRFGAGRNIENLVFVSCGSGVGAGVILGGRLIVGRYSLGEVGHAIIDLEFRQTVEQLGSGIALKRLADTAVTATVSGNVVCSANHDLAPIIQVSTAFAICVRLIALCFMPDRIIIGGGCAGAHPELLAAARDEIGRIGDILPLKAEDVVEAELGDNASLVGGYPYWLQTRRTDVSTSMVIEKERKSNQTPREKP